MADSSTAAPAPDKTNANTSNPRASQQVFTTYELLATILLGVPAHDLLFAAQVNKTWGAVINTSRPINTKVCAKLSERSHGPSMSRGLSSNGDWNEAITFAWGRVVIRRRGACEAIAVVPTAPPSYAVSWCPMTRAVVLGVRDRRLGIHWLEERQGWEFSLRDQSQGARNTGLVSSYGFGTGVGRYLGMFHGGRDRLWWWRE